MRFIHLKPQKLVAIKKLPISLIYCDIGRTFIVPWTIEVHSQNVAKPVAMSSKYILLLAKTTVNLMGPTISTLVCIKFAFIFENIR